MVSQYQSGNGRRSRRLVISFLLISVFFHLESHSIYAQENETDLESRIDFLRTENYIPIFMEADRVNQRGILDFYFYIPRSISSFTQYNYELDTNIFQLFSGPRIRSAVFFQSIEEDQEIDSEGIPIPIPNDQNRLEEQEFISDKEQLEYELLESLQLDWDLDDLVKVDFRFRTLSVGYHALPDFEISTPDEDYLLEPVLIGVFQSNSGLIPPQLEWQASKNDAIEGETVFLSLEMTRLPDPSFPDSVNVSAPAQGIFEEVTGLGEITQETVANYQLSRVPVATFLFTSTESGSLRIPSASIIWEGIRIVADPVDLEIEETPLGSDSGGAIGQFDIVLDFNEDKAQMGKTISFDFRLEGQGNLGFINLPDISVINGTITSQRENSNFIANESGYVGYQGRLYGINPQGEGELQIFVPGFSYLDPEDKTIKTINAQSTVVEVLPARQSFSESSFADRKLFNYEESRSLIYSEFYLQGLAYLLLLPAPLIIFIASIVNKRKEKKMLRLGMLGIVALLSLSSTATSEQTANLVGIEDQYRIEFDEAITAFEEGYFAKSITIFQNLNEQDTNLAVLYNLSLCHFHSSNIARSIFYLRKAIRMDPMNSILREALSQLEEEQGLRRQFSIPEFPEGDLFFWLIIGSINILLLLLYFWRNSFRITRVMTMSLLGIIAAIALAGMIYSSSIRITNEAIVSDSGAIMKRIPEEEASSWLEMKPGASVQTLISSGDFLQIETSYGIKAWILEDDLYRISEDG